MPPHHSSGKRLFLNYKIKLERQTGKTIRAGKLRHIQITTVSKN